MKYIALILLTLSFTAFADNRASSLTDLECMAQNVYHEARGQGALGMQMVIIVVNNRVKSKHYPNTICGVVFQRKQFSWTLKPNKLKLDKYVEIMQFVSKHYLEKGGNILGYHNSSVAPSWARELKVAKVVGDHIFYVKR